MSLEDIENVMRAVRSVSGASPDLVYMSISNLKMLLLKMGLTEAEADAFIEALPDDDS